MDNPIDVLRALYKLVEDGDLVRNTDKDANYEHFLLQSLRITQILKRAQAILEK